MKIIKVVITDAEIRSKFELEDGCEFEIERLQIELPASKPVVARHATLAAKAEGSKSSGGGVDMGDKSKAEQMIKDGMKAGTIVEATGMKIQDVYNLKNAMKKDGRLEVIPEREGEVMLTPPTPQKPAESVEINDDYYAEKIRELWVGTTMQSVDVCNELDISMMKFNKIIRQYVISKV